MARVLITGGAGFIGRYLCRRLVAAENDVTILDNLSPQIHGSVDAAEILGECTKSVRFLKGDVRSPEDWLAAIEGQQFVVHLAAETGTGQSMYEVGRYVDVNVKGTAILIDMLLRGEHEVKRVVVASSRAVYGEGRYRCDAHGAVFPEGRRLEDLEAGFFEPRCPICGMQVEPDLTDERSPVRVSSVYGGTKFLQEQMLLNSLPPAGIGAVALRLQNVYGPGQSLKNPYTGLLSVFSTRIRNRRGIVLFEDGRESRDFVYVEDAARAAELALHSGNLDGEVINIGTGKRVSVLRVAEELSRQFNIDVPVEISGKYRVGDIRHAVADITRAQDRLGFSPTVEFPEGCKRFAEWVTDQPVEADRFDQSMEELRGRGLYK